MVGKAAFLEHFFLLSFLLQIIVNTRWLPDITGKVKWCVQWPAILQQLLCRPAGLCKKVQRYGVTERSWSFPAVPKLFSRPASTFPDNAVRFKGDHQVDVKWLPSLPQSADLNNTGLLWNVLECRVRSGFPPPSSLKAFPLQRRRVNIQLLTVHNLEGSVPWGTGRPLKGGPTSLLGTWCSNTVRDFHSQKII